MGYARVQHLMEQRVPLTVERLTDRDVEQEVIHLAFAKVSTAPPIQHLVAVWTDANLAGEGHGSTPRAWVTGRLGLMACTFRTRRLLELSDTDAAWLAGLLEGEGSFFASRRENKLRGTVSMQSSDQDVIDRVQRITGTGNITHVLRENRKPVWGWALCAKADVVALMHRMLPLMGERRSQQIMTALAALDPSPQP